jgi:hypothetical protein
LTLSVIKQRLDRADTSRRLRPDMIRDAFSARQAVRQPDQDTVPTTGRRIGSPSDDEIGDDGGVVAAGGAGLDVRIVDRRGGEATLPQVVEARLDPTPDMATAIHTTPQAMAR